CTQGAGHKPALCFFFPPSPPRDCLLMNAFHCVRAASVALVFSLALVTGCSSKTSVRGKGTLDGEKVDGGGITLRPAGEGRTGAGEIKDGQYYLDAERGLQPGSYKVEISWNKKTGKLIPSNDPPNKVEETRQAVPRKYNAETQLTLDVVGGSNTKDFELTSK